MSHGAMWVSSGSAIAMNISRVRGTNALLDDYPAIRADVKTYLYLIYITLQNSTEFYVFVSSSCALMACGKSLVELAHAVFGRQARSGTYHPTSMAVHNGGAFCRA